MTNTLKRKWCSWAGRGDTPGVASSYGAKGETAVLLSTFGALTAEMMLFALGFEVNCNVVVLAVFVIYFGFMVVREPRLFIEFFYVLVMSAFNVAGVFCCERGVFLEELQVVSYYSNALAPICIFWILFIGAVCFVAEHARRQVDAVSEWSIGKKWINSILVGALLLELVVFSQIAASPYFVVGVDRFEYLSSHMSGWVSSLKSHLVVFAPISAMAFRGGSRRLPIAFGLFLALIYIWTGDKFGAYFFALYLVGLVISIKLDPTGARKALGVFCAAVIVLICLVFAQNAVLRGYDLKDNFEYLSDRLAQQGEIWWSVYTQAQGDGAGLEAFAEDIALSVSSDPNAYASSGQWKMMDIAGHGSHIVVSRIASKVPYTATTTATMFYYFSWIGCVAFYAVMGIVYAVYVYSVIRAFSSMRILESIVLTEAMVMMNNLLFASNFGDFISVKSAILLAALLLLRLWKPVGGRRGHSRTSVQLRRRA